MSYLIEKPLNNNVLLLEKDNEKMVAIGKGIGFNKTSGEKIDSFDSEVKIFYLTSDHKFKTSVDVDGLEKELKSIIHILSRELDISETSHFELLYDHMLLAIERIKLGFDFENPFNEEIKMIYAKEYILAKKIAELVNERIHVKFSDNEISFLTLHIKSITSLTPVNQTFKEIRILYEAIEQTCRQLNVEHVHGDIGEKAMFYSLRELMLNANKFKAIDEKFNMSTKTVLMEEYVIAELVLEKLCKKLMVVINENIISLFAIDIYKFRIHKQNI